ncbi:MAG: hypothetical protein ABIC91_06200 [Nanoarchaeota archaeon]|nr:hypothetical protein [Nanoarchaeota archaeon]MBU1850256.1 hypothetical protein [Nanoarchaeota archaeon]
MRTTKIELLKTMFIIIILVLTIGLVSATEQSYLSATLMKYEPQPSTPGNYVKAYIKLENSGNGQAKNVALEVLPEYPFSIDDGRKSKEQIGIIGGQSFYTAEFTMRVDKNAVEGTNYLRVRYNIDEQQTKWTEQKLAISVQTQDAILSIESISIEPSEITPGKAGTIKITLSNPSDSYISDISAQIDLSSTTLPFAPHNSATEKNIYQIKERQKQELEYEIIALPGAEANVYKIPLDISYYDNVGNSYSKSELIGVVVNSEPDIKVTVDGTDLLRSQMVGTITLKVVNKGLSDLKFLNLKLTETDDFEIMSSSSEEYIGNLDSDDFETVEYKIKLKKTGEIKIPLELEYKDTNNNPYSESLSVNLKVRTAEELGQEKSKGGIWIIIIVVVVVGFFIYRNRKKKKKKESNA